MRKFIIFTLSALIFISLIVIVFGGFELFNGMIQGIGHSLAQTGNDIIALLKPLFILGLIGGFPIYFTCLLVGLGKGASATSKSVVDLAEEISKSKKKMKGK